MKQLTLTLFFVAALTGCGGGSSSGGGAPSPAPETPSVPDNSDKTEPPTALKMTDLTVADDFSYRTDLPVTLSIDIDQLDGTRSYISTYASYSQASNGELQPDLSTKLISASVINGSAELSFVAATEMDTILVEIWKMGEVSPSRQVIDLANQAQNNTISLNQL